jgi:hypothetical protein
MPELPRDDRPPRTEGLSLLTRSQLEAIDRCDDAGALLIDRPDRWDIWPADTGKGEGE